MLWPWPVSRGLAVMCYRKIESMSLICRGFLQVLSEGDIVTVQILTSQSVSIGNTICVSSMRLCRRAALISVKAGEYIIRHSTLL